MPKSFLATEDETAVVDSSGRVPEVHWLEHDLYFIDTHKKQPRWDIKPIPVERRCFLKFTEADVFLETETSYSEFWYATQKTGLTHEDKTIYFDRFRQESVSISYSSLVSFSIEDPFAFYSHRALKNGPAIGVLIAHAHHGKFVQIASNRERGSLVHLFQLLTETFIGNKRALMRFRLTQQGIRRRAHHSDDDVI